MVHVPYSDELIKEEPHLIQWQKIYPGRELIMGPDPKKKNIPIHNVALTGRAGNNNSATEIMNYISMEEFLLPITGQIQIMKDTEIELGYTGGIISVGIGMAVGEEYGRIQQHRQNRVGSTWHKSGEYAQTLKSHLPIIVAEKKILAEYIIQALNAGAIPGKHIGASPAVMSVARHKGIEPCYENMWPEAFVELASVGFTKEWMQEKVELLSDEEIIKRANEIIPGVERGKAYKVSEIVEVRTIEL